MQQPLSRLTSADVRGGRQSAKIALPIHHAALAQLSEWVKAVALANGLSARCAFRLELVLTETVTNVVDHAFAPGADGVITVQITCEPGCVIAQVDDGGLPFDPTPLPVHD